MQVYALSVDYKPFNKSTKKISQSQEAKVKVAGKQKKRQQASGTKGGNQAKAKDANEQK